VTSSRDKGLSGLVTSSRDNGLSGLVSSRNLLQLVTCKICLTPSDYVERYGRMTVISQLPIFGRHMTLTETHLNVTAADFMSTVLNFRHIYVILLDNQFNVHLI
jgi:hypothetical protein